MKVPFITKMLRYNFAHARKWLELDQLRGALVIYASTPAVYGQSRLCRPDDSARERPLNPYGYSKLVVDPLLQPARALSRPRTWGR